MKSRDIKQTIIENAEQIRRLHGRVHETLQRRDQGLEERQEWLRACAEMRARYDALAFPGGYTETDAPARIIAGDPDAMEAAICFLETRPYFFRSGYMFETILRKAKRAPLSREQRARLDVVQRRLEEWRRKRQKTSETADPSLRSERQDFGGDC